MITPGNAGTLDMLNRGEIAMGPVWVDMFYTWQSDGRLSPDLKIALIGPGMPGQPMYYVVPAKTAQPRAGARSSSSWPPAPKCRPKASSSGSTGIRASTPSTCRRKLDEATWNKLFADMTPEDLHQGQAVPDRALLHDILEAYERQVAN